MSDEFIKLPTPNLSGVLNVEEAMGIRRSARSFKDDPLSLEQLSQLLWAAQGITGQSGYRTIPSAGATFPIEVFAVVGLNTVQSLHKGVYHYDAKSHVLTLHAEGDLRQSLSDAALGEESIATVPLNIVVCAIFQRTTSIYGKRGERYVYIEAGHLGQNVALQALSLGLATVMIGAFHDEEVQEVLHLDEPVRPLYIIPAGVPVHS
jgi:SagB-type dehydrogenase family enzyme